MKKALRLSLTLATSLVAGCYTYRPVAGAVTPSREPVRITLTDSGAVTLASQLGPATEEVTGRVRADSAGAYVVSVLATRRRGGSEIDWRGEQVAVPRALVAHTAQRRFSRRRTTLATVGLFVAAIVAREAFWGQGGVFGGAPPGGGPSER